MSIQVPNRTVAPPIQQIETLDLLPVENIKLDNGLQVYAIHAGEEDVVKLEFVFKAGKWYETQNLQADLCARMMREGTNNKSAKEIADFFDFYGSNFNATSGNEVASVSLYCLTKHLEVQLPLLMEIFTEASFPENELKTICTNRKQRLLVELEKNDFLANRHFAQALWGSKHPFGRVTKLEDLDNINTSHLQAFYKQHFNANNCFAIISGKFDSSLIGILNKIFGSNAWKGNAAMDNTYSIESGEQLNIYEEKPQSVQSALEIGNITINKYHPDFAKLTVMNTLFGGYFGSRLMDNIREEKGYTYGIHSSIVSYPHGAYINISSEVGKEVREATLQEVKNEIEIMRTELVEAEELETVKNYMSGRILRSVDGALRYSETLKGLLLYNQGPEHIHHLLKAVQETTTEDILQLANTYLDYEKMYKVSVG